jgi:S1-C subfamily serine protease
MRYNRLRFFCFLAILFLAPAAIAREVPDPASQAGTLEGRLGIHGRWGAEIRFVQDGSLASEMRLSVGDLIVLVDGRTMREFASLLEFLGAIRESMSRGTLELGVLKYDKASRSYAALTTVSLPAGMRNWQPFGMFGIQSTLSFLIDDVLPGRPAHRMEVRSGDVLDMLNGRGLGSLRGPSEADEILDKINSTKDKEITVVLFRGKPDDPVAKPDGESRKMKGHL